jgi:internalin A
VVDRLYDELQKRKYEVIRDKHDLGYRRLISEFMQRIGKGKLVVTVISDKYLKSPHCMYELLEIYRNGGFTDRVFPIVLRDAKLYSLPDRLGYVQHWKREKEKIEAQIADIGLAAFSGEGTFKEYDIYYREVFNNIDKLMAILADWNALTPQLLEEDNFETLVAAIDARIATG